MNYVEYFLLPKALKPKATISELYHKIMTMAHYFNLSIKSKTYWLLNPSWDVLN